MREESEESARRHPMKPNRINSLTRVPAWLQGVVSGENYAAVVIGWIVGGLVGGLLVCYGLLRLGIWAGRV